MEPFGGIGAAFTLIQRSASGKDITDLNLTANNGITIGCYWKRDAVNGSIT